MPRKKKAIAAEESTAIPVEPKAELIAATTAAANGNKDIFDKEGELVVDVFETNSHFVVLSAIAGAQINDIDISIDKDMMVIKGHRPTPHDSNGTTYFYQECYWGPFSRKIVLPENIDTGSAEAAMNKGMLTIKIPKLKSQEA